MLFLFLLKKNSEGCVFLKGSNEAPFYYLCLQSSFIPLCDMICVFKMAQFQNFKFREIWQTYQYILKMQSLSNFSLICMEIKKDTAIFIRHFIAVIKVLKSIDQFMQALLNLLCIIFFKSIHSCKFTTKRCKFKTSKKNHEWKKSA